MADSAIASNLRTLRAQRQLTADEAAAGMGLSRYSLRMHEKGERTPSLETLNSYARFYSVDVAWITGEVPWLDVRSNVGPGWVEQEDVDRGVEALMSHLEGLRPYERYRLASIIYAFLGKAR